MPKRVRAGLLVWGTILLFFGLLFLAAFLFGNGSSQAERLVILVSCIFCLTGSGLLLGFGIRNIVLVSKHNANLEKENEGTLMVTTCYGCQTIVYCSYKDFGTHYRFPEGFIYCPVCKKPLGRNLFQKMPFEQLQILQSNQQQQAQQQMWQQQIYWQQQQKWMPQQTSQQPLQQEPQYPQQPQEPPRYQQ